MLTFPGGEREEIHISDGSWDLLGVVSTCAAAADFFFDLLAAVWSELVFLVRDLGELKLCVLFLADPSCSCCGCLFLVGSIQFGVDVLFFLGFQIKGVRKLGIVVLQIRERECFFQQIFFSVFAFIGLSIFEYIGSSLVSSRNEVCCEWDNVH